MTTEVPTSAEFCRHFHIGDILSITTGLLVSPRHIDGVYDILSYMTGESLFTHQLPRAGDECRGPLFDQHPALLAVRVPVQFKDKDHVERWLAEQVESLGETLAVAPLQPEDHTNIGPLTELALMAPHLTVIPVVVVDAE